MNSNSNGKRTSISNSKAKRCGNTKGRSSVLSPSWRLIWPPSVYSNNVMLLCPQRLAKRNRFNSQRQQCVLIVVIFFPTPTQPNVIVVGKRPTNNANALNSLIKHHVRMEQIGVHGPQLCNPLGFFGNVSVPFFLTLHSCTTRNHCSLIRMQRFPCLLKMNSHFLVESTMLQCVKVQELVVPS